MKKKITSLKSTAVEDRLFGIETRLSRIESAVTDKDFATMRLNSKVGGVEKSMVRLEDRMEKFHEKLLAEFTEFRSTIYNLLDPIAGQLKKFNEEQAIHAGQHQETYEKLEKLEKIHPKFSHTLSA